MVDRNRVAKVRKSRVAPAKDLLDVFGLESVCHLIVSGATMTELAAKAGVSLGTLIVWIEADPERSARAREARVQSARLWDEKATKAIEDAPDKFNLDKAKELAHHYRWRASKIAPKEYGDSTTLRGDKESPLVPSQVHLSGRVEMSPGEAYRRMLNGSK